MLVSEQLSARKGGVVPWLCGSAVLRRPTMSGCRKRLDICAGEGVMSRRDSKLVGEV